MDVAIKLLGGRYHVLQVLFANSAFEPDSFPLLVRFRFLLEGRVREQDLEDVVAAAQELDRHVHNGEEGKCGQREEDAQSRAKRAQVQWRERPRSRAGA